MEMSDESDEEDWFMSHVKLELGNRGAMKAERLVRKLLW